MRIVITTMPDAESAMALADAIVQQKLAACVQVLPPMTSVYVWEGEVKRESEHLLLIKTSLGSYNALERFIIEQHPYDVPEIVAFDAARASSAYLDWMKGELG